MLSRSPVSRRAASHLSALSLKALTPALPIACCFLAVVTGQVVAQPERSAGPSPDAASTDEDSANEQAVRDAAFAKMLSGATLEGSYTNTGANGDGAELSKDQYTLGEVKKIGRQMWLIPARIQYAEHDVTLPITVLVKWAGDTPVIVVDKLGLPHFGSVSARVMFFDDHYAGYWKHGKHGGHLFGVIRPADSRPKLEEKPVD